METAAAAAVEHPVLEGVARVGYVMSGLVHVLIGWIALQLALGQSSDSADQSGALGALASAPGGSIVLWVGGISMAVLALWFAVDAWLGGRLQQGAKETGKRVVTSLGKAAVYAALATTALRFAVGGSSDSEEQTSQLTASLMEAVAGRVLIGVIALVVFGIGCFHVFRGASRGFEDDLRRSRSETISVTITVSGVIGFIAKGLALIGVGLLFAWAAIGADPEKASGLDGALKTMADLPAGSIVLVIVGAGLILFGIFSVLRSRYAPA